MIKKIIAIITISLSLLIFIIFSASFLINSNSIGKNFIANFGITATNIGKITIIKFPFPYLVIESIKEEEKIELEKIEVHFSLWSFLRFKPKISHLNVLDAKIYSQNNKLSIYDHEQLINNFLKSNLKDIDINITNLNIINKQDYSILNFTNCSLYKKNSLSSNTVFKAYNNNIGDISGSIKQNNEFIDFNLNVDNNNYIFKLVQVYKNLNLEIKLESGTGEYEIKNISSLLYNILPDLNYVLNKFKQNAPINVKFNIYALEDILQLKDITINAPFISGGGMMNISKNNKVASLITLHFPKIDINSLLNSNIPDQFSNPYFNSRFDFADKLLKIDINIDEIILSNNEALNKILFSSNLIGGVLKVEEFAGTIKSGGQFKLTGDVTQNTIRSMFDGKIYLAHNNLNILLDTLGFSGATIKENVPFTVSSDLKLTLIDLYLRNFLLKTDDLDIIGDISTKFIASIPHVNAALNFSLLDLSKQNYPIISPIFAFIENLTQGMKNLDYLNKFIPIRTLNCLANLDFTIDNIIFADNSFEKVNLLANISPANLKINNLDIRTGNNYISTSWNLEAASLQPVLTVGIKDGVFETNFLHPASLLALRNKLFNDYSLDKISLNISGKLAKLSQNDLTLENLIFSLANDKNLFKINNIEANMLNGKFQGTGNILLDPNSINFVYALNTIDLTGLSALLPKIFPPLSGKGSINGNFSTNGNDLQNQLYNLTTQSQFAINNITVNNFSIDSFIEKINSQNYNSQNLDNDLKTVSQGSNIINAVQGNIELQKGIVLLKNVAFTTQYSSGAASMAVNIYNFNMDLSSILSFYIPNITPNANDPNNKNIQTNLGMKIQGSIFNPKQIIDSSELKKLFLIPEASIKNSVTKQ
ncbi:AsmA-like C-terminal region-containing protein [Rickettsia endosymbiont of Halotydeus destructor]|uniref:AsmA family protein n=1 Tax=Rickettsia endosymbiont of Halotydeus destructor TaxID=2996754 RepID=UPI003BB14849